MTYSSINYTFHAIHCIPNTYLSYKQNFVPFVCLHSILPLPIFHLWGPLSDLFFILIFWSIIELQHARFIQSYLTLCDTIDCSLPGFSVLGILQAKMLEWVAMPSPRGSYQPMDRTLASPALRGGFFNINTTWVLCISKWLSQCLVSICHHTKRYFWSKMI